MPSWQLVRANFCLLCFTSVLWRPEYGYAQDALKLPPQKGSIEWLSFSRDGKLLGSSTTDKEDGIHVWEVAGCKLLRVLQGDERQLRCFVFTPDGKSIISIDREGMVKLRNLSTGEIRLSFQGRSMGTTVITPDGKTLIVSGDKEAATFYDLNTGNQVAVLKETTGKEAGMALSADGKLLATGRSDGTVALWDVAARKQLIVFPHKRIAEAVAFSPDCTTLAVGTGDGQLVLWDLKFNKDKGKMKVGKELGSIDALVFSPDGRRLVLAGAGYIPALLWDVNWWRPERGFQPEKQKGVLFVRSLALSPDGRKLAVGDSRSNSITLLTLPPTKPKE